MWWVLFFVVLAAVGFAVWVRIAPSDPAVWHVDPEAAPGTGRPNSARQDLVIPAPLDVVAQRLIRIATAEGAIRLAGDDRHATWITRTRLMRYPDYTTIRLIPTEGGTRLVAFARARFGYGDQGVNAARLTRWVAAAQED